MKVPSYALQELRAACKAVEGFPPLPESDERLVWNALGCARSVLLSDPIRAAIWLSNDQEAIEQFEEQVRQRQQPPASMGPRRVCGFCGELFAGVPLRSKSHSSMQFCSTACLMAWSSRPNPAT